MQFSAMTMNMFFPDYDDPGEDHGIIQMTVEQSIWFAELGYNVWFTDHHFRGPWHSNTLQFAAYVAPQLPPDRYIGFGVLSIPFYHPLRLVESMNLLDQLTDGRVLFGVGSGWPGVEPTGLGVDAEYHGSGRAAEDTLDVMQRLWTYQGRRSGVHVFRGLEQRPDHAARHARTVHQAAPDHHSHREPRIGTHSGRANGLAGLLRHLRQRRARTDADLPQGARRSESSARCRGEVPALVLVRLAKHRGRTNRRARQRSAKRSRRRSRWRYGGATSNATAQSRGR